MSLLKPYWPQTTSKSQVYDRLRASKIGQASIKPIWRLYQQPQLFTCSNSESQQNFRSITVLHESVALVQAEESCFRKLANLNGGPCTLSHCIQLILHQQQRTMASLLHCCLQKRKTVNLKTVKNLILIAHKYIRLMKINEF